MIQPESTAKGIAMPNLEGVIVTTQDRSRESFDALAPGKVSWFTLISGDLTTSDRMSAGIMELEPGGTGLRPHRHNPPEIYHVIAGAGVLTIEHVDTVVGVGSTAFIPRDAEHSLRNTGEGLLRIFYVFPTDSFAEVVYRYSSAD